MPNACEQKNTRACTHTHELTVTLQTCFTPMTTSQRTVISYNTEIVKSVSTLCKITIRCEIYIWHTYTDTSVELPTNRHLNEKLAKYSVHLKSNEIQNGPTSRIEKDSLSPYSLVGFHFIEREQIWTIQFSSMNLAQRILFNNTRFREIKNTTILMRIFLFYLRFVFLKLLIKNNFFLFRCVVIMTWTVNSI